jgi:hypothetical protein
MVLMNFTPLLAAKEDNWACQELPCTVVYSEAEWRAL